MKRRDKSAGFTLIELLVVIAMIGILSSIAVPNFLHMVTANRLNGATRQVVTDMMAARMKAVSKSCKAQITFSDNHHEYRVWVDEDKDGAVDSGEEIVKSIQSDYPGVSIYKYVVFNTIIFNSRGGADQFFVVSVNNGVGSKNITTNVSGRVRVT